MESDSDHKSSLPPDQHREMNPAPDRVSGVWRAKLEKMMGDTPEEKWGSRMIRVASDMMLVCDGDLQILFHNRAFLRGIGYQSGTFIGHNLMEFFPMADQAEAGRAFDGLRHGPQAGLRINATFLTAVGHQQFDARVTRSRCKRGGMYLYLVAREAVIQEAPSIKRIETAPIDPILKGLPLAAFRTDRKLRVTHVCGALWEEIGYDASQLIGSDLSDTHCHVTPPFLHELDFCDTMAGLTVHSDLNWKGKGYEITVEPFINESRKVIGTVGMIREAKKAPEDVGIEHLQFPKPQDFTQALKPMPAYQKTRKIEIGPPLDSKTEDENSTDEKSVHHRFPSPAATSETLPMKPLVEEEAGGSAADDLVSRGFVSPNIVDFGSEGEEIGRSSSGRINEPSELESSENGIQIEKSPSALFTEPIPPIERPERVREIEIGPPGKAAEVAELSDMAKPPVNGFLAPVNQPSSLEMGDAAEGVEEIETLRAKIQPRRLSPSDVLSENDDGDTADDPIVLAN